MTGYNALKDGATLFLLSKRLSFSMRSLYFTNAMSYSSKNITNDSQVNQLSGVFSIQSSYFTNSAIRGELSYSILPNSSIQSTALTHQWEFAKKSNVKTSLVHSLGRAPHRTFLLLNLNRTFDKLIAGIVASASSEHNYSLGISLSSQMGFEPRERRMIASSEDIMHTGTVSAKTYLSPSPQGESPDAPLPIENARLKMEGDGLKGRSGDTGVLFLKGLPVHIPLEFEVEENSLGDPYWVSQRGKMHVITRPGRPFLLDVPIIETGEIEGYVYQRKGGVQKPLSRAWVELYNLEGELVKRTPSSYDGFFLLDRVPLGSYTVSLDKSQLKGLCSEESLIHKVSLSSEEPLVSTEFLADYEYERK